MKRAMRYGVFILMDVVFSLFFTSGCAMVLSIAARICSIEMDVVLGLCMSVGRGWMWENGTVSFQMAYRFLSMHVHSGKRGFFFG